MVGWLNGEGRRALAIAALAAAILTVSSSSVEHECILQFAVKTEQSESKALRHLLICSRAASGQDRTEIGSTVWTS